jgi:hypothetical protein
MSLHVNLRETDLCAYVRQSQLRYRTVHSSSHGRLEMLLMIDISRTALQRKMVSPTPLDERETSPRSYSDTDWYIACKKLPTNWKVARQVCRKQSTKTKTRSQRPSFQCSGYCNKKERLERYGADHYRVSIRGSALLLSDGECSAMEPQSNKTIGALKAPKCSWLSNVSLLSTSKLDEL